MRTTLTLILLFLFNAPMYAQLTAGEVPDGSIAYDVNINLSVSQQFASDTADVELDCDDFRDAQVALLRGAPELDVPHVATLLFTDNDVEVCMDMASGFQQRPKYHAFGETMDCSGDFDWQPADTLVLGDLGGFFGIGPWTIDSMYIAFRRGGEMGWILLSFDLTGTDELHLQIHRILPLCQGTTAVAEQERPTPVTLFPNPGNGGTIHVESTQALRQLEVLDPTGRVIARYGGSVRTIAAPQHAGSYLVRAIFANGGTSVTHFSRQ